METARVADGSARDEHALELAACGGHAGLPVGADGASGPAGGQPLQQAQLSGGEGTVPGDQGQGDWMAPHPAGPVELGQDRKRIGGPATGADAAAYVSEQRGRDRTPFAGGMELARLAGGSSISATVD